MGVVLALEVPLLLVWIIAMCFGGTVDMNGSRWRSLQVPDEVDEAMPVPRVAFRTVRIVPDDEHVRFSARWRIEAESDGWFEGLLAGQGVRLTKATWNGRSAVITERVEGVMVAGEVRDGAIWVEVEGEILGDATRDRVVLDLMAAASGEVVVVTEMDPIVTARGPVVAVGGRIWCGGSGLGLRLVPHKAPVDRGTLAVAHAALGLTVGEVVYSAQARLRWELRAGELSTVHFTVGDAAPDLEITGPAVADWSRSGQAVTVNLLRPESYLVELEARWTGAVPRGDTGKIAVPDLVPADAFRFDRTLHLSRDGQIEVVPVLTNWSGVPFQELPEWGRGLVLGTPTASFLASGRASGELKTFRFTPVSAPPAFVDVATITAAVNQEGTVLMRAHYAVRNDRAAHLRIRPPAGASVVGARVAGQTAVVAVDGQDWLIPLEKSVETVEGLLSFPVEVILLLSQDPWERREQRALPVPAVDAPVAVSRARVYLPPGWKSRAEAGDSDRVDDFSSGHGIAYGSGSGKAAEAENLMQQAVGAWMSNDFDQVQGLLDDLDDIGGLDGNAMRLQSNLDVISGEAAGEYDVTLERRIKGQAKARSDDDEREQAQSLKEADEAYLSGDYGRAQTNYKKALKIGEKLDKLEQTESVEVSSRNVALESKLLEVEILSKDLEKRGPNERSGSGLPDPGGARVGTLIFDAGPAHSGIAESPVAKPSPAPEPVLPVGEEEEASSGVRSALNDAVGSLAMEASSVVGQGTKALRLPGIGAAKKRVPQAVQAPPPPPTLFEDTGPRTDSAAAKPSGPVVTAVQMTAVIPTQGQEVRYETLLLEASADWALDLNSKFHRRE
jgi:hypothetical protein